MVSAGAGGVAVLGGIRLMQDQRGSGVVRLSYVDAEGSGRDSWSVAVVESLIQRPAW